MPLNEKEKDSLVTDLLSRGHTAMEKVRGLGTDRIDYFYQTMNMNSDLS